MMMMMMMIMIIITTKEISVFEMGVIIILIQNLLSQKL